MCNKAYSFGLSVKFDQIVFKHAIGVPTIQQAVELQAVLSDAKKCQWYALIKFEKCFIFDYNWFSDWTDLYEADEQIMYQINSFVSNVNFIWYTNIGNVYIIFKFGKFIHAMFHEDGLPVDTQELCLNPGP